MHNMKLENHKKEKKNINRMFYPRTQVKLYTIPSKNVHVIQLYIHFSIRGAISFVLVVGLVLFFFFLVLIVLVLVRVVIPFQQSDHHIVVCSFQ